jgi:hypothetical protein
MGGTPIKNNFLNFRKNVTSTENCFEKLFLMGVPRIQKKTPGIPSFRWQFIWHNFASLFAP